MDLIKRILKQSGNYGLAEVYMRCKARGYQRSFGSVCRQIRNKGIETGYERKKKLYKVSKMEGKYTGDKVQIDIKYVPEECIKFPCYGHRYYQITGIDEYSRKRVLKIVKEKSTYETRKYLMELEKEMGFQITTIQVDNGSEFVGDKDKSGKKVHLRKRSDTWE